MNKFDIWNGIVNIWLHQFYIAPGTTVLMMEIFLQLQGKYEQKTMKANKI